MDRICMIIDTKKKSNLFVDIDCINNTLKVIDKTNCEDISENLHPEIKRTIKAILYDLKEKAY